MKYKAKDVMKVFDNHVVSIAKAAGLDRQAIYKWRNNPEQVLSAEVVITLEHNTSGVFLFKKEDYIINSK